MISKLHPTLLKIARVSRQEMEAFAKKHSSIGDPKDLCCYCAISSYFVQKLADRFGFQCTFVEGCAFYHKGLYQKDFIPKRGDINHCWIEFGDVIIDITATQFSIKKNVYIVDIEDTRYIPVNKDNAAFKAIKNGWPKGQSPLTHKGELQVRLNKLARELRQDGFTRI